MIRKVVTSGLIIMLLSVSILAADSSASEQNINTLPWEIIAKKFRDGNRVRLSMEPDNDGKQQEGKKAGDVTPYSIYIFKPGEVVTVDPPPREMTDSSAQTTDVHLARREGDLWQDLGRRTVKIGPNGISLEPGIASQGFYRLDFGVTRQSDEFADSELFVIVSNNWKKDLLTFCQAMKQEIELNSDPQFIRSSITVSHFDNVMEIVTQTTTLSREMLQTLANAIQGKKMFDIGQCPDFVVGGLNKIRLKRFQGARITEFVVFVPKNYDNSRKWPIYFRVDGRRFSVGKYGTNEEASIYHEGMIDVWWHTSSIKNLQWKEYKACFKALKSKLNIDADRVYLYGLCGNSIGAMSLALHYPDQWAGCFVSVANSFRHLAGNAFNLPLIFISDSHHIVGRDGIDAYYNFAVKCFEYYGCRFFKSYTATKLSTAQNEHPLKVVRKQNPMHVLFTADSLEAAKAYWVKIDGRIDENFLGRIDSSIRGQTVLVNTDNIDAYTLNLELAPLDCNRPVEIIENSKSLGTATGSVFTKRSEKYKNVPHIKNAHLHGPVDDVFTDPYIVTWTGGEKNEKFARQLASSAPCFEDIDLPSDFIDTHNVIFVGRLEQSKHFAELADKLPIAIEDEKLTADSKVYEGDLGAIFIYPNLLNAQKYIAIFSGTSDKARGLLGNAWEQIKGNKVADIGIFEVAENNRARWLRCEKFNTTWNWHESWDAPLVKLTGTYPKWKWRQWIARILRKQLKADVTISEDPFASSELPDTGEFTLRDISKIFKNDWIVKINLKGSNLRELLTVSFNDISSKQDFIPVIDGASLIKQPAGSDVICINELESDRLYTVALPYKAVNGKRLGMVIKNYHLEDDGFLILLLKQYLAENTDIDLDAELANMLLNIF